MTPVDMSVPVEADEDEVLVVMVVAAVAALNTAATSSVLRELYCVPVTAGDVIHEFKAPVATSAGST